jgi:uncharacterized protein (DUF1015 family)
MPEIKPFKGILYNPNKVSHANVVAPPYDVISPKLQSELYEHSPYNIVRLILGREEDQYASAAKSFDEWKQSGIMEQEQEPSLYVLVQNFTLPDGKTFERRGFIAACRLEDFGRGSIFPHEKTLASPKEDRLKLFQATGAMFSQIFSIYSDPDNHVEQILQREMGEPPRIDVTFEGVRNQLWDLKKVENISSIEKYMRTQRVFVADGHHRYETALLYRSMMRKRCPRYRGVEAFNFVPMFFANMNDPGMVILPTHRLVHGIPDFDQSVLIERLRTHFIIEQCASAEILIHRLTESSSGAFGLILRSVPHFLLLQCVDPSIMKKLDVPDILAQLDVTILHTMIFKYILKMTDDDQMKKRYLDYEKDPQRAIEAVGAGVMQAAFLMNPTLINQVRAVAEAGYTMPQKSTYFYPKLLSGIVTYSFEGVLS